MTTRDRHGGRPAGGYVAALDGVRALAIGAVLVFHGGFGWASGGFLGVDVFFVLSGFLITGLLVSEYHTSGGVAFGRFWARRARRLLPALLAVLAAVGAYAVLLAPADTLHQLRRDSLATLAYIANWNQMLTGPGYFAA
ncbi:MAG TPA: acyltransferase, partial [Acidimicrobiales bacterium]|nr:acyltransferase [Acidimicrobiales bacterium]